MKNQIIKIFKEIDPLGFIEMDFPAEEYELEWNEICYELEKMNEENKNSIPDMVRSIFVKKFDLQTYEHNKIKITKLAEKIQDLRQV